MPSRPRQRLFCMADGYQDLNGWGYIDQVTVATCYCLFQIRMYISIGFCRLCFQQSNCVFSRVRVTRTLVLCVCFVDRCLSFYPFSFGHCVLSFDLRILFTPLVSSNSFFFRIKVRICVVSYTIVHQSLMFCSNRSQLIGQFINTQLNSIVTIHLVTIKCQEID